MDQNKLKVLQEINYTIHPHCGICDSGKLSADGWGYCTVHTYEHLKHSEEMSLVSINMAGVCDSFKENGLMVAVKLGAFGQFVKHDD